MTTENELDLKRFEWLVKNSSERLLKPRQNSEFDLDLRTNWVTPTLICSGPVGGFTSMREAIDIEMQREKDKK